MAFVRLYICLFWCAALVHFAKAMFEEQAGEVDWYVRETRETSPPCCAHASRASRSYRHQKYMGKPKSVAFSETKPDVVCSGERLAVHGMICFLQMYVGTHSNVVAAVSLKRGKLRKF